MYTITTKIGKLKTGPAGLPGFLLAVLADQRGRISLSHLPVCGSLLFFFFGFVALCLDELR